MTNEKINLNAVAFMTNIIATNAEKTEGFSYRCGRKRSGFCAYLKSIEDITFKPEELVKAYLDFACAELPHQYEINALNALKRREENARVLAAAYGE